ncbi:hypothetical protein MPTP_1680 [Melissococcus plutonius ATCC 35311]|uniref:Uncharacterized protein n=1 Tax=Melissococcus plutonius (strain ATCC 35311 / DSM 29964 / CIP 104052 / LMG 20360 / NCIMB 702443) TaxID=940190 RepID=F3YC78_MELPT|nr:hypothetical protein MPTP_1680 [Melissococcus plutonius ATCC 35311]
MKKKFLLLKTEIPPFIIIGRMIIKTLEKFANKTMFVF